MSTPRYRAWRFMHPDIDTEAPYPGLQIAPQGDIAMVDENDSVRQALFLLLSTSPGERVMRPEYGCQIHQLVFSPNDDTTAGLAIYYVRRAIERWERRIDILRLDAGRNPDFAEQLDIMLEYRVRATQRIETIVISMNLVGEKINLVGEMS